MLVVGIISIDDYTNYGNRLQNYALTKLFEKRNISVINGIRVYTKEGWISKTKNPIKRIIKRFIPFSMIKNSLRPISNIHNELLEIRKHNFEGFIKKYTFIIEPIICANYKSALKMLEKYNISYYITGSDQVWNPYYAGEDYQFLSFTDKNKRLSFAASIGTDFIPDKLEWYYKKKLVEMKHLSVREKKAAEIIKELTGRDAEITLDPTLLLNREEWKLAIKKPDINIEKSYILAYFLGEIPNALKRFAEEKNIRIYYLNSKEYPELYVLNPGEFLYLISNASYVFTDSFHAVAFSIIFQKEFYVFERFQNGVNSMFSRIESITSRFDLSNRIQDRDYIVEQDMITHWDHIEKELSYESEKSMNKIISVMKE